MRPQLISLSAVHPSTNRAYHRQNEPTHFWIQRVHVFLLLVMQCYYYHLIYLFIIYLLIISE